MFLEVINKYLCGLLMPLILIISGIFFLFKFKFFYISHPLRTIKNIKKSKCGFKALSVALAGTLGIGNIVGVASAIIMGGIGSIFWMWISSVLAMALKYAEVVLAMKTRRKIKGIFKGGAFYYIYDGCKNKIGKKRAYFLSCFFSILCVCNSLTTGNLVQINSVSSIIPIKPLLFGILFTILAYIIIVGGYKRISKISSFLIPFLTFTYVILSSIIIFKNFEKIPQLIINIVKDAFSIKCILSGFCGYGIINSMRYGISRGILSNEAGCGTSPTAHASSENDDPHSQGCLGIFEVFIDTILLCSLTAFVILLSNSYCENPTSLVLLSFEKFFGSTGRYVIFIISILFAFATVICQYFYGIESLEYITKSKRIKNIFLFIFCTVILIGSVIPMNLMWQISDFVIALMTITNVVFLFLFSKDI